MELAQDRAQWQAFVLAVLKHLFQLAENKFISQMDLREIGYVWEVGERVS